MSRIGAGVPNAEALNTENKINIKRPLVVQADNTRVQPNPQAFKAVNHTAGIKQANTELKNQTQNTQPNKNNAEKAHSWHSTVAHKSHYAHNAFDVLVEAAPAIKGAKNLVKAAEHLAHHAEHAGSVGKIVKSTITGAKAAQGATATTMVVAKGVGGFLGKLAPGAGAAIAAYSAFENAGKLDKAMSNGNYKQAALAGAQIALNVVGGVAGCVPGAGTLISAGCGLVSIGISFMQDD